MKRRSFLATAGAAAISGAAELAPALAAGKTLRHTRKAMTKPTMNPLLRPWTGPYGGAPPFDAIKVDMFPAAFEASIAQNRAEIARIADDPAPPTFENTIAAQEDAGRVYGRVQSVWGVYTSTLNTKDVQKIASRILSSCR